MPLFVAASTFGALNGGIFTTARLSIHILLLLLLLIASNG